MPLESYQKQAKVRKIKPLRDIVIVFPAQKQEMSEGGVVLPPSAQKNETTGVVLRLDKEFIEQEHGSCQIKEGDRVIFAQYAGTEVVVQDSKGEDITILAMVYKNIIGIAEEEEIQ